MEKFENEFGSVICYDLIKCDLNDPEDRKKLFELNILEEKCVNFVIKTIEILLELDK